MHKLRISPVRADRLYQQNHTGLYRSDDRGETWVDIGAGKGLSSTFGFAAAVHPRNADMFYAVPLTSAESRFFPDGRAVVWRTQDAGASWQRLTAGLPQRNAWQVVLREGMATDGWDPLGLYFATTTGEIYASRNEGETWTECASRLPQVLSIDAGALAPEG